MIDFRHAAADAATFRCHAAAAAFHYAIMPLTLVYALC